MPQISHKCCAVNEIRNNALNCRLFTQFCEENGEAFHRLLLHIAVRWFLKGLLDNICQFMRLFNSKIQK